ncbi:MAG: PepSY domain-containing protein [Pseudomonadota bacterium]
MKFAIAAIAALGLSAGAAMADDLSDDEAAKILAALAEAQCEMDTDDVEKEDDGYELDDVFCADGQFDMKMDLEFNITEKNAD